MTIKTAFSAVKPLTVSYLTVPCFLVSLVLPLFRVNPVPFRRALFLASG